MTEVPRDKVIEKIKKILALAEGGTEHEANVAAKMANQVLLKYNLTMAEVTTHINAKERAINHEQYQIGNLWKRSEGNWVISMFSVVSEHNLCSIFYSPHYQKFSGEWVPPKVTIIGTPVNIELVEFMSRQLAERLRAIEPRKWREYSRMGGWEKRGTFRRGFYVGALMGIKSQLNAQKQELQHDPKMNALMVMSDKLIEDYKAQFKIGKGRASRVSGSSGVHAGHQVGKNMSIHGGIGGSNGTQFGGHLKPKS